MLNLLNLDQLRVFVTIADYGSFSEASRKLRRAQSSVSNAIVNLETALGVTLFDRSGWRPQMTPDALALLADARTILARSERLIIRASGMAQGLEAEISMVVDVMFPVLQLVELVAQFQRKFPEVTLRLCTDVLGGVPEKVLAGEYNLGIQGSLPDIAAGLTSRPIGEIALLPVSSPNHALAGKTAVPSEGLREHTQIVLTDSSKRTAGRQFSVFGARTILTSDLGSKHAMLRAGLGWGFMPQSFVQQDLDDGRLVTLDISERNARHKSMPLFLIFRDGDSLGPARRWVTDLLESAGVGKDIFFK